MEVTGRGAPLPSPGEEPFPGRAAFDLSSTGLTLQEYTSLQHYYSEKRGDLEKLPHPTFISRNIQADPPIPRSVVYNPDEPGKGLYLLLKTHGGIKPIGRGGDNSVTLAIHLDTGEKMAWRTAHIKDMKERERAAIRITQKYPEHFATGFLVEYMGPWRERSDTEKTGPREEEVAKIGCMMPFYEGGDLMALLEKEDALLELGEEEMIAQEPLLNPIEELRLCCELAEHVAFLHDLNLVHRDLKPENTLLTKDGSLRLADFAFCEPPGAVSELFEGSPGYVAPEVIKGMDSKEKRYTIAKTIDIWSLGCVLAEVILGPGWTHWTGQHQNDWSKILDPVALSQARRHFFPDFKKPNSVDSVIVKCLQLEPAQRKITAHEIATELRRILTLMQS